MAKKAYLLRCIGIGTGGVLGGLWAGGVLSAEVVGPVGLFVIVCCTIKAGLVGIFCTTKVAFNNNNQTEV